MKLENRSLDEVERLYQNGYISYEDARDYIKKWNTGPHFTQAVLLDDRIKNFDPEKSGWVYEHLKEEFDWK